MSRKRRVLIGVSMALIHKEPSHAAERVTEARMGERPTVLLEADAGRWLRVRLEDGYEGWLRSWLATPDDDGWPGTRVAEIDVPVAHVLSKPGATGEPVSDLVIGTRLKVTGRVSNGWVAVILPDGRGGHLSVTDLLRGRPINADSARRPARVPALLATARRFAGTPYVWGGKCPHGFDCSGLTQMVHELHGLSLPRDSKDQEAWLARRTKSIRSPLLVPPGGLIFFGAKGGPASHVGFSLGGGTFWHAQGRVREQSLDPRNPNYHEDLAKLFRVGLSPHPGILFQAGTHLGR